MTSTLSPPSTTPATLDLREALVGSDLRVPVLGGRWVSHVNLDNAASTPAFRAVSDSVQEFLPFSSGVHRGNGYRSRLSTELFETARTRIAEFVGADRARDVVVFGKNTTEALNTLARTIALRPDAIVLTTVLEHHSNDLPWRARAHTVHVKARSDGTLDEAHLDHLLAVHAGRIALLAVTGTSNVTGVVPPIHRLAEKVHAVGGRIVVDAAQLAPHRAIDMRTHDDSGHLDFVAMSAHKMYAPFGAGALIGARAALATRPDHVGGGTVHAVTLDDVAWADLPDRAEAGSPNVLGTIAFAEAASMLERVGFDRITAHETHLTRHAHARLSALAGVTIHGPTDPDIDKTGVIPFSVDGYDHELVGAILDFEHGIGVRTGCFCAHPYVAHLLGLTRRESAAWLARARHGDKQGAPGLVRFSVGCHNTADDVDRAVDALECILAGDVRGVYRRDGHGSYVPETGVDVPAFRA